MTLSRNSIQANGFSIIEIVVVISIAALMITIGVQNFSGTQQRLSFDQEVAEVRRLLVQARNSAMTGREEITAKFDFEKNILTLSRGVAGEQKAYDSHQLRPGLRFVTTDNDNSQRRSQEVFFFSDGQSSGASIVVTSDIGSRQLTVDWLGGRVVVEKL